MQHHILILGSEYKRHPTAQLPTPLERSLCLCGAMLMSYQGGSSGVRSMVEPVALAVTSPLSASFALTGCLVQGGLMGNPSVAPRGCALQGLLLPDASSGLGAAP